jgi:hypothetical protein
MLIIEFFEPGCERKHQPSSAPPVVRIDDATPPMRAAGSRPAIPALAPMLEIGTHHAYETG